MAKLPPFYWTKKQGPRHIADRHTTLCRRPMLGNNHHKTRKDAPPCEECEELYTKEDKVQA